MRELERRVVVAVPLAAPPIPRPAFPKSSMDRRTKKRLKRRSAPNPVLVRSMAETVAKIKLVSTIRAARLQRETARLKPETSIPTGETLAIVDELVERFRRCTTDWSRLQVLRDAQRVLSEATVGGRWDRKRGSKEWKRAIARDTRPSALVGLDYGISPSYVRRIRGEHLMG